MANDDKRWKWPFQGGYTYNIDQSVRSYGQTGGITAHTVNVGPQPRRLDDNFRTQLLQMVPRDRLVEMDSANDPEAIAFANEIRSFLAAHGYSIAKGMSYSQSFPPLMGQHVDIESDPKKARIMIGHREG